MIRIHFGEVLPDRPVIPLALSCGLGSTHAYGHRKNALARLSERAPTLWAESSLKEAQIVVYPHRFTDDAYTRAISATARNANLPLLFFEHGDNENPAMPSHGTIYRTALDSRRLRPREAAMSGLSDDMLEGLHHPAEVSPATTRPTVGFCGNVSGFTTDLKEAAQMRWHVLSATRLRRRAIAALSGSPRVANQFLLRKRYWGGTVKGSEGGVGISDHTRSALLRSEFVANILGNAYTLCVRGAGNYSIRFYEVLSAGRIPVFVDSHCVLPFSEAIDWKRHCVWVKASDVDQIADIVADFHSRLGPNGLAQLQIDNRRIWLEYLEATAFYTRVIDLALNQASS